MWANPQKTEEIFNGKLHFLWSDTKDLCGSKTQKCGIDLNWDGSKNGGSQKKQKTTTTARGFKCLAI